MPDTFFSKCLPAIRRDIGRCSGMTNCDISPTTEDEFTSIYLDANSRYRITGALLQTSFMGKACMVQENPLFEFLVYNSESWGTRRLQFEDGVNMGLKKLKPFIMVGRKAFINNNYWAGSGGVTTPGTAPNGEAFDLRIDAASLQSIPVNQGWFPNGNKIFISGKGAGGQNTNTAWTVVDSAVVGDVVRLWLASANAGSVLPSSKLEKPTEGVIMRGTNNVNPYERYCEDLPILNLKSAYPVWIQHSRWTMCNDDLTMQFLGAIREGNPLYAEYYSTEEAERNRQNISDFQNRVAHDALFGKAINANQTVNLWDNLPTVTSFTDAGTSGSGLYIPGIEGRCIAYKAAVVGIYEQFYECGRVLDLLGQTMNWPEIQSELYTMHRIRQGNGDKSNIIEMVVDSAFRPLFIQALIQQLVAKYENTARFNFEPSDTTLQSGYVFRDFKLDFPAGVTLRVVSHYALDDLLTAHTATSSGLTSVGRKALLIDWSTTYMAVVNSYSKTNRTGTIEDLARVNELALCVMEVPQKSMKLNDMLWGMVVECPKASLWLENFAFEVPEAINAVGPYDGYGNDPSND